MRNLELTHEEIALVMEALNKYYTTILTEAGVVRNILGPSVAVEELLDKASEVSNLLGDIEEGKKDI
jgi:hypothetical protein